ncbi:hypothetical protein [Trabulsiella odontotermitis]|uniref:hypothetical protein n=1 Tax=Trabulsiella odontotermitis TaxID=379893 RepID=UPI001EE6C86E|nr:hypothetical protein [Trabulsiella odontotermitis]
MAGNFKVGMTLTANDDASAVLVKGLKLTTKAAARHPAGNLPDYRQLQPPRPLRGGISP